MIVSFKMLYTGRMVFQLIFSRSRYTAIPIISGVKDIPQAQRRTHLFSKSCIPVTFLCAYDTISAKIYAKLARLRSALRLRLRCRS